MTLHIQYSNGRYDYVDRRTLDRLIEENGVRHFYRPSERKWVDVESDPVRGRLRFFRLSENRWINMDVGAPDVGIDFDYVGVERRAERATA